MRYTPDQGRILSLGLTLRKRWHGHLDTTSSAVLGV
jgi:hypothetical protein